jgi:hypothetical protein
VCASLLRHDGFSSDRTGHAVTCPLNHDSTFIMLQTFPAVTGTAP